LKTFPTVTPITDPIIAPATTSENQWIVIETPCDVHSIEDNNSLHHFAAWVYITTADDIANATVVWDEGQP